MKKTAKFWNILMFVIMMMLVLVSCGGSNDDSNSGSTPNVIDGPTIWSGKRISELKILETWTYLNGKPHPERPFNFKCEYDSKGRLSKIFGDVTVLEDKVVTKTEEITSIDYELQTVSIWDFNGHGTKMRTFGFSLNKDGYISQIGTCFLSYENGYLTGVDQSRKLSSLVYDENDVIKASISNLKNGNLSLLYMTYGNVNNQGDLYVRVRLTDDKLGRFLLNFRETGIVFIIYHAGLFGKVSKHFLHLQDKNAASGIFDLEGEDESEYLKFSFTCE